ncbi:MAG: hypothetical protein K2Y05_12260 [Hyphomicrobiaceae bacterium]|nr:hypothetical protein [Hyphomicrobiaceae bacterium]
MTMIVRLAAVLVLATVSVPASARGLGEAGELEAARANARAGGPNSERDKELLSRYGCLSGTNSDFCRKLEGRPVKRTSGKRPRQY